MARPNPKSSIIDRTPCLASMPRRSALIATPQPLALALSGGGWRAALVAAGAIRFLSSAGLLATLRHVTSVSGGSISAALLARHWQILERENFSTRCVDANIVEPVLSLAGSRPSVAFRLLASAAKRIHRWNPTRSLAQLLDDELFDSTKLHNLPTGCWFEFNATNLTTGARFRLSQDVVGDYITGSISSQVADLTLGSAVSASCAVPGLFRPFSLPADMFPCGELAGSVRLVDGGVVDNLGLDAIKFDRQEMPDLLAIVLDAGSGFSLKSSRFSIVRAHQINYGQSTSVRARHAVERFQDSNKADQGILINLRTQLPENLTTPEIAMFLEKCGSSPRRKDIELAKTKTTLGHIAKQRCIQLIDRGYWLTGASLALHQPHLFRQPNQGVEHLPEHWRFGTEQTGDMK